MIQKTRGVKSRVTIIEYFSIVVKEKKASFKTTVCVSVTLCWAGSRRNIKYGQGHAIFNSVMGAVHTVALSFKLYIYIPSPANWRIFYCDFYYYCSARPTAIPRMTVMSEKCYAAVKNKIKVLPWTNLYWFTGFKTWMMPHHLTELPT